MGTSVTRLPLIAGLNLLLLFCSSCTFYDKPLSPGAQADGRNAILYGRFGLIKDHYSNFNLGLWIKNVDSGSSYYVRFATNDPVCAVTVNPGNYRIAGFVGANPEHETQCRELFSPGALKGRPALPFTARAGAQIYIGDFAGQVNDDSLIVEWRIRGLTNNFDATSVEFRQKYPGLMTGPVVSLFDPQAGIN